MRPTSADRRVVYRYGSRPFVSGRSSSHLWPVHPIIIITIIIILKIIVWYIHVDLLPHGIDALRVVDLKIANNRTYSKRSSSVVGEVTPVHRRPAPLPHRARARGGSFTFLRTSWRAGGHSPRACAAAVLLYRRARTTDGFSCRHFHSRTRPPRKRLFVDDTRR